MAKPEECSRGQEFSRTGRIYGRFVEGFFKISTPLTKLTKKNVPFVWTQECADSFQLLKEELTTTPLLTLTTRQIHTYASKVGLGCVLMQNGNVVAYGSK